MRFAWWVLTLTACGRLSFDPTSNVQPDAKAPVMPWAREAGSVYSVTRDPDGNSYAVGALSTTPIDLGSGPVQSVGSADAYIASYDRAGQLRWLKQYGGTNYDVAYAPAADIDGNLWVAGIFNDTVDFGAGPETAVAMADMFMVALDRDGNRRWSKTWGTARYDIASGAALTSAGVLFTGQIDAAIDFGGGALTPDGGDVFIARVDPMTGAYKSARLTGGALTDRNAVIASSNAGVAIMFWSEQDVDAGGGNLPKRGFIDTMVVGLDASGAYRWAHRIGMDDPTISATTLGHDAVMDAAGNFTTVGYYDSAIDAGGAVLPTNGDDYFIASYDIDGNHRYSRQLLSAGADVQVELDAAGNVYIAAEYVDPVDLGGGTLTSAGMNDVVVASFDIDGNHRWSRSFGSTGNDGLLGFGVGVDGDISMAMMFAAPTEVDGNSISGNVMFQLAAP